MDMHDFERAFGLFGLRNGVESLHGKIKSENKKHFLVNANQMFFISALFYEII